MTDEERNTEKERLEEIKKGLIAMRELLAEEGRWCQDFYARDKNAHSTDPWDPNACQWCVMGAAIKVFGNDELPSALDIEHCTIGPADAYGERISLNELVANVVGYINVAAWQDLETTTHADVLHMLDKAILSFKFWYMADAPSPEPAS